MLADLDTSVPDGTALQSGGHASEHVHASTQSSASSNLGADGFSRRGVSSDCDLSPSPSPSVPLRDLGGESSPRPSAFNSSASPCSRCRDTSSRPHIHGSSNNPLFFPFNPTPAQAQSVLTSVCTPYAALVSIAAEHETTVEALAAWLALETTQKSLDIIEQACFRRARLAAANVLCDVVHSLSLSLQGHIQIENNHPWERTYLGIKQREMVRANARRNAWLLFRISRAHPSVPIDPSTLRFLHTLKRERHGSSVPSKPASDFDAPFPSSPDNAPSGDVHRTLDFTVGTTGAESADSEGSPSASEGVGVASERTASVSERTSSSSSSSSSSSAAAAAAGSPLPSPAEPVSGEAEPVRPVPDAPPSRDDPVPRECTNKQTSSPPRRAAGCHRFQPVESGSTACPSSCSSPPPGRTSLTSPASTLLTRCGTARARDDPA